MAPGRSRRGGAPRRNASAPRTARGEARRGTELVDRVLLAGRSRCSPRARLPGGGGASARTGVACVASSRTSAGRGRTDSAATEQDQASPWTGRDDADQRAPPDDGRRGPSIRQAEVPDAIARGRTSEPRRGKPARASSPPACRNAEPASSSVPTSFGPGTASGPRSAIAIPASNTPAAQSAARRRTPGSGTARRKDHVERDLASAYVHDAEVQRDERRRVGPSAG